MNDDEAVACREQNYFDMINMTDLTNFNFCDQPKCGSDSGQGEDTDMKQELDPSSSQYSNNNKT